MWRIKDGRAYGLMWAERELPKGYQWFEVASDVSQVALNSNTAWYLKSDGKVTHMLYLKSEHFYVHCYFYRYI